MIRRIHALYFSATGTTKKLVTELAARLSASLAVPVEEYDFTPLWARMETRSFSADELVIVGVPVIAGRVPNLLLPYLNSLWGSGAPVVPVVMFGNRDYEDALIELRDILQHDGFKPVAAAACVGEHSFSVTLAAGRPDAADLQELDDFAARLLHKLQSGAPYEPLFVKGNTPPRPYYIAQFPDGTPIDFPSMKPKTTADCTACGLCAEQCPLGAIDPDDCITIIGSCMKCSRCVKICPLGAKYFDDPGYLYHKEMLESKFGGRRAANDWFI